MSCQIQTNRYEGWMMMKKKQKVAINQTNSRGNPNRWIINEPGLYSLILRSRKLSAKVFKRWITHEVIPAILRT